MMIYTKKLTAPEMIKMEVSMKDLSGGWAAPAPKFTAAQPEVADWHEGVRASSVPVQHFPTEDWSSQPATEFRSAAPTAQASEWGGTPLSGFKLFFHSLMETRLTKNNISKNNNNNNLSKR